MKKFAKQQIAFAVCIKNKKYDVALDVAKFYRIISDGEAESRGYLRVIDESGEDYGCAGDRFFRLELPRPLRKKTGLHWPPDSAS